MDNLPNNLTTDNKTGSLIRENSPIENAGGFVLKRGSKPLWMSTTGYFSIAAAASLGLFFVTLGLLNDESENDSSWLAAGIAASLVMGLAVIAREVLLRQARTRYLLQRDGFGHQITPSKRVKNDKKFTLEQNSSLLKILQRKSKEADSVLTAASKHLEVFKASQEYLEVAQAELQKIQTGSPRLPALRNGLDTVRAIHKHHLLRWAAEETKRLTREAGILVAMDEKLETARRASEALKFGLQFYPEETQLLNSLAAVNEFTVSIRVTHWIELAEREAFKGHYDIAIDHYQDALFYLSRESSLAGAEFEEMQSKLNVEIQAISLIQEQHKELHRHLPSNSKFNQ